MVPKVTIKFSGTSGTQEFDMGDAQQQQELNKIISAEIEADADDCYEKSELKRMINATNAYMAIWDMFQELRKVYKYSENDQDVDYAEKWRQVMHECCESYGIDMDDLH